MNVNVERLREIAVAIAERRWGELNMRIPADESRDADLVVAAAAREIQTLRADRDAALARAEKAEKDAERHLDLLRQARHYVADKRLNEDELGGRRRRETNQDAADRISMAMENNEVRANLLEAITAAIDDARAKE